MTLSSPSSGTSLGASTAATTTITDVPPVLGQTFTLTAAVETKVLTTGNDTVDGTTTANSADGDNIVDASTGDSDIANIPDSHGFCGVAITIMDA